MKISQLFGRKPTTTTNRYPANTFPAETKPTRSRLGSVVLIIITLASLGAGGYYYYNYQKLKNSSPSVVGAAEAKDLQNKVGRLMVLPADESPTIATVSDYSQLKDQPFFAKSTNGDKLLIYSKAKIAVLYNPSLNKIINVGPLSINTQTK